MGKSTISMAIFNSKLLIYQRVWEVWKSGLFLSSILTAMFYKFKEGKWESFNMFDFKGCKIMFKKKYMLNLPAMFSHQIHSTSGWNWGVPNVPLKKSSVPFHLQRIPSIHQHFWLEGKGSEDPHRYYRDRWTMTMKSPMKSQCVDCGPPWNRDFSRNVDAQKRLPCLGFMEEHTQKKTSIHRVDQPTSTTVGSGNDGGTIICNCLVVEPPTLWKSYEFVSWDGDYSQLNGKIIHSCSKPPIR